MTILKKEILAHLNKELHRKETDIDEHILEAVKDLSLQDDFLWVESTVSTIIGRPYYSLPPDCKGKIKTIKMNNHEPLGKMFWDEYQRAIANQTSDNYAEPKGFVMHGGFWYAYPTPDIVYTATLFYSAFILEEVEGVKVVNDIKFKDIYRTAIYTKTKAQWCKSKSMKSAAKDYEWEYINLIIPRLQKLIPRETKFVIYRDL